MNYTSVLYYAFLAALILLYYIVPDRAKWPVLLAGSLVFYRLLVGNTLMFAAFLLMIAVSYGFGLLIERSSAKRSPAAEGSPAAKRLPASKGSPASKGLLAAGILVTAAPLIAFKVSEFGSAHFANVAAHVPAPFSSGKSLLLPIGASFFTLQMIAYLVDIYRGKISAQRNPLRYALFISFFPQIIQGPIPRYEQLGEQLFTPHKFDSRNLVRGFHLILWGFFLKFMIADKAGVVVDTVFGNAKMYKGVYVLVAGALYSIQLYADFQSCTTLSRGAAKCLGIDVINNFDHPYLATSIKDFWRRWHISLSTWLRDYVYIPAGGSRRGTFRKNLNLVLTFAVSGIWHGGSFKFLFWGLLHAFYQITGDFTMKARDRVYELLRIDRDSYLRHIFKSAGTFFLAMTAWIIFRAGSLRTALQMILSMFTVRNYWVLWDDSLLTLGLDWKEWSVLLHSIALLFVISLLQTKGSVSAWILRQHIIVRWTVYIGAVLAVMLCGTYGFGYDAKAFIYGGVLMQRSFMAKLQSAVRPVAFVLLLCLCVRGVTSILVPKNYTREWMSPVPTYCGFYRLEDNTADVLFLGSSHSYSGFCPQVLYNEYGITSYNLAMGNQSLLLNYYWLKEALKTQKPSTVVLESIFAFHRDDSATNAPESANQKSLGYMHWSENRIGAIRALCEADPENYSWESFVPVFRYHDRWKELHEEDFTAGEIAGRSGLMGFSGAFRYYCRIDDYKPYERAKDTEPEEMLPLMRTYLDKITDLCKERGIRLVLTLTPCLSASASRSAALCRYAEEKGLEFYDFNLASEIAGMQYDFAVDNADEDHPNIWGAQKVTTRLGELLVGRGEGEEGQTSQSGDLQSLPAGEKAGEALTGHKDAQWEEADAVYQAALRDAELMHCKKIDEYIPRLQDERYCVLISVKGDASKGLDGQSAAHLRELGLQEDLSDLGGDAYVAVIDGGEVLLEERAESSVSEQGSIRDGKTMFSIRSEGAGAESSDGASSIRIDGAEQSVDGAGINIVVVLRENCACFDKVSFDTAAGGEAACVR